MSGILPSDYRMESGSSKYMKFGPGDNRFRALAPPILGKLLWSMDAQGQRKPVRRRYGQLMSDLTPAVSKFGKEERIRDFLAFVVWDFKDSTIKILEITQATVITALDGLSKDAEWGPMWDHNSGYAININKTGSERDTVYQVLPSPKRPADPAMLKALADAPIRLEALYDGGDPFGQPQTRPDAPHGNVGPANEPAEPPQDEKFYEGLVFDVKKAKTETGRTKYGIVLPAGMTIGTFSTTLGGYAEKAMANRRACRIGYTNDGRFNTLTSITEMKIEAQVPDTADDTSEIPF